MTFNDIKVRVHNDGFCVVPLSLSIVEDAFRLKLSFVVFLIAFINSRVLSIEKLELLEDIDLPLVLSVIQIEECVIVDVSRKSFQGILILLPHHRTCTYLNLKLHLGVTCINDQENHVRC